MLGFKQILIVAFGGAVGSVLRYKLGCFAIGILAALVEHHDLFSPSIRLLLFTGLLGGFTTFSAFGYESVFLLRRGLASVASGYVMLSVVCGLAAVAGGM